MKTRFENRFCVVIAICALAAVRSEADVLELKNGQVLTGKYAGGTAGTIRFETAGGLQAVESGKVLSLTFTGDGMPAAAPAAAPGVAPAPAASPASPAAAPGIVTVPAGTVLLVRMVDGVSSRDPQGKRFAATLQADLVVNGVMAVKAGTRLFGRVEKAKQAGRLAGKSELELRLSELTVVGSLLQIRTSAHEQAGANAMKKTVGAAGAGAAIGAMVDNTGGAGKGAAIGALASGLKKGEAIVIPPGSMLEFKVELPITIQNAR